MKKKPVRNIKKTKKPTSVILIASPGGGKGTTVEGLVGAGYQVQSLDFRGVLKEEVRRGGRDGRLIDVAQKAGRMVPIDIMQRAVTTAFKRLDPTDGLVILDGLPRDRTQIDLALNGIEGFGSERKIVLHLECNPVIAGCRIVLRARDQMDLDPMVIAARMEEFERVTMPVVRDFREHAPRYGVEFFHYNSNNLKGEFPNLLRILDL